MPGSRLPQETFDYIIDFLHNKPHTLKNCCLVAKSWVSRARKHLFGEIKIASLTELNAWWEVFPDPGSSPGHHTHSLVLHSGKLIPFVVVEECSRIQPFSNVVRLEIWDAYEPPDLRSSQILKIICSLPLLEDLEIASYRMGEDHNTGPGFQPPASPPLTGTLEVSLIEGIEHIARGLLGLPNAIHFRKFVCTLHRGVDLQWITALVDGCSDALEYIEITRGRDPSTGTIDLSKATKLKEVAFWFDDRLDVMWVTNALRTITPGHRGLQKISIYTPCYEKEPIERIAREICKQWTDLDGLLVQLWESHTVRTEVIYVGGEEGEVYDKLVTGLLPEITERNIIELVTHASSD